MVIRDMKGGALNKILIENVLISVFNKDGLEELVPSLMDANPGVRFMSTGGTYKKIKKMLGDDAGDHLIKVSEYTDFPEMDGGLVKTLHPKIHAGLLGERSNPEHQKYLAETLDGGVYIDMVVVNLYPFDEVTADETVPFETARGHIDIGGPTMIRAGAKNFASCAVVCNPADYGKLLEHIEENDGCTTLRQRLEYAVGVFATTHEYDGHISKFFNSKLDNLDEIAASYLAADGE
ncbi:MAG: hypothetical protein V3V78_01825 [Candidatus Woesearchaeota archaeon]